MLDVRTRRFRALSGLAIVCGSLSFSYIMLLIISHFFFANIIRRFLLLTSDIENIDSSYVLKLNYMRYTGV